MLKFLCNIIFTKGFIKIIYGQIIKINYPPKRATESKIRRAVLKNVISEILKSEGLLTTRLLICILYQCIIALVW